MLVMVLVGVLRHHVTSLLNSIPKTSAKKIRESQALLRSRTLRSPKNSSDLPSASFIARKEYYSKAFGQQLYLANPPPPLVDGQPPNPLSDPAGMEVLVFCYTILLHRLYLDHDGWNEEKYGHDHSSDVNHVVDHLFLFWICSQ